MNAEAGLAEIAAEQLRRIGAQPAVDHLRVDRSEVGFEVHVAGVVFERRVRSDRG